MTTPSALTRFVPGAGVGLVGCRAVVLVDADPNSPLVTELAGLVDDGADFDAFVRLFIDRMSAGLPDVGVVYLEPDSGVRTLLRGNVGVVLAHSTGPESAWDAAGVATWTERMESSVESVSLHLASQRSDAGAYRVDSGVVPAAALYRELADGIVVADPGAFEPEPAGVPEPSSSPDWPVSSDPGPEPEPEPEPEAEPEPDAEPEPEQEAEPEPAPPVWSIPPAPAADVVSPFADVADGAESPVEAIEVDGPDADADAAENPDADGPDADSSGAEDQEPQEPVSAEEAEPEDPEPAETDHLSTIQYSATERLSLDEPDDADSDDAEPEPDAVLVEAVDDDDEFDHLFGATQYRPVAAAGVDDVDDSGALIGSVPGGASLAGDAADPVDQREGDHDGMTISLADLRASGAIPPAAPVAPQPAPGAVVVHAVECSAGHLNPPNAVTCRVCAVEIPPQAHTTVPRPPLGRLVFSDGTEFVLDRPALMGRAPKVEGHVAGTLPELIVLSSPAKEMSGTHLEVRLEGWQVIVVDRHSTNGTVVHLPNVAPQRLHPGDPMPIVPATEVNLADEVTFVYEASM